jgi:hypothetical protein
MTPLFGLRFTGSLSHDRPQISQLRLSLLQS